MSNVNVSPLRLALRASVFFLSLGAAGLILSGCTTDGLGMGSTKAPAKAAASSEQDRSAGAVPEKDRKLPTLVVTNDPPPQVIYRRGSRDTVLSKDGNQGYAPLDTSNVETLVTRKVAELSLDLSSINRNVSDYRDRLVSVQSKCDVSASRYYELVAAINTELQSGTTPGNPLLIERWNAAQEHLQNLTDTAGYLNGLATDLSDEATRASFLQESVRSAYMLSGAVKEDHKKLHALEDDVNQNIVAINRLMTAVNDEISRRGAYLRSERLNMNTLSLAIANGELYGQNLANSLYKRAAEDGQDSFKSGEVAGPTGAMQERRRPLVIIRFDRPGVDYEQPLYSAVSQALEKYPSAKFDLVAVSSSQGNPAQVALATTEARKNGESVLRSLTQMGLPMERVNLNAANSGDVRNSEIHIYIR